MSSHQRAIRSSATNDDDTRRASRRADPEDSLFEAQRTFNEGDDIEATDDELLEAMKKKSCGGTMTDKRTHLYPIRPNLVAVAERIMGSNATLGRIFLENLPRENQMKGSGAWSTNDFALNVLKMWKTMQQFKSTAAVKETASWRKAEEALQKYVDLAKANIQADRMQKVSAAMVELKGPALNRGYLIRGYKPGATSDDPEGDLALHICVRCKHSCTDYPDSNRDVAERNLAAMNAYQAKVAAFDREQAKPGADKKKKRPPAPKPEEEIKHCHCYQLNCFGKPDGPGNTCPLKCIDPVTEQPYGKDGNGICLCPVCKCNCSCCHVVGSDCVG